MKKKLKKTKPTWLSRSETLRLGLSQRHLATILAAVITVSLLSVWALVSSLWFIWFLLPSSAELKVAIDVTNPIVGQQLASQTTLSPELISLALEHAAKFAVARSQGQIYIVILPRDFDLFRIPAPLTEAGWKVKRLGPLLTATKTSVSNADFRGFGTAARETLLIVKDSSQPVTPTAIFSLKANYLPFLSESVRGTAVAEQRLIKATLSIGGAPIESNPPQPLTSTDSALNIIVPGNALSVIPEDLQQQWNSLLQQRLGFKRTKPNLFAYASQFDRVALRLQGSEAALSVYGNPAAFVDTVNSWVQDEERHGRLVKQAFVLPDGTLGYERVPGPAQDVFQPAQEGCQSSLDSPDPVWLCIRNNIATLASSEALAQPSPLPEDQWAIQIQPDKRPQLSPTKPQLSRNETPEPQLSRNETSPQRGVNPTDRVPAGLSRSETLREGLTPSSCQQQSDVTANLLCQLESLNIYGVGNTIYIQAQLK